MTLKGVIAVILRYFTEIVWERRGGRNIWVIFYHFSLGPTLWYTFDKAALCHLEIRDWCQYNSKTEGLRHTSGGLIRERRRKNCPCLFQVCRCGGWCASVRTLDWLQATDTALRRVSQSQMMTSGVVMLTVRLGQILLLRRRRRLFVYNKNAV